jgi:hypothetical protein
MILVSAHDVSRLPQTIPLPFTVMGVRVEDALGTNSSTGEGAAKAEVAAANAAIALKVFMMGGVCG